MAIPNHIYKGTNCLKSSPSVECLSRLAIALLNPGSRYEIIPMKLSRLQALGWEIRIILIKLSRLQALGWERL